jgi:dTDP-4-dehydrorhamnose 3,5-epimerase
MIKTNNFQFIETGLKDAYYIKKKKRIDSRGFFQRLYCLDEFKSVVKKKIKNINNSLTVQKGTIRGMHYQLSPASEIKIITCVKGAIFDVIVDIRKNSPTFLKKFTIELSQENNSSLVVPEGFAHGFQSLKKNSEIIYLTTAFYSSKKERGLNALDKKLKIKWPIKKKFFSEKDKTQKFIDNNFQGI